MRRDLRTKSVFSASSRPLAYRLATLLLLVCLSLVGCSDDSPAPSGSTNATGAAAPQPAAPAASRGASHKVCLAISSDGLGDKGYNDMQYTALVEAKARHQFIMDVATMQDGDADPAARVMGELIARNCTVVVAGQGWSMKKAVDALAPIYPEVLFLLVDESPMTFHPNVAGTRFHVEQAAYLAGWIAASLSRTGALASVAGKAVPPVLDFIQGFEAGAKGKRPDITLHRIFIAEAQPEANPWNSPAIAQDIAERLIRQHKADILFAVAGGSNQGVFRAAKDNGVHALGVDTDQDYLAKGVILTSVMKRLDVALRSVVETIMTGSFENKRYSFDLKNQGVSLSPMTYSREALPPALLEELRGIEARIEAGEIQVPSSR